MEPKLTFGLRANELIHISEVEKGLSCECICPACSAKLVAKKGNIKKQHFAHDKGDSCKYAVETALHLAAKKILEVEKKLWLPKVLLKFPLDRENWKISDSILLTFDEVLLEEKCKNVVPDIIVIHKGRKLFIEIKVTHGIDDVKLSRLFDLDISVLEIDLSNENRDFTWDYLKKKIINDIDNKIWIQNVKSDNIFTKLLDLSEKKKVIQRGFAFHVDYCPNNERIWKGKSYANVMDDCICCEFCVARETDESYENENQEEYIYCLGKRNIKTYEQYKNICKNKNQQC